MKKKLNLFALMLLLIGQTILGPIATVSASELDDTFFEDPVTESESADEVVVEEGSDADSGETLPDDTESGESSDGNPSDESTSEDENGESDETPSDFEESTEEGTGDGVVGEPSDEVEGLPGEDEEAGVDGEEVAPEADGEIELFDYEVADLNAELSFTNLIVNGKTITNPTEAAQVTPKLGDKVDLNYTFSITADKDYEVGSTFKFELPQALLNFDNGKLSGTVTDLETGFSADYTTVGRTVTLTTTERLGEADAFIGTLHFFAHFSADGTNGDLEQKLEIPIVGKDSVEIPFTFDPGVSGDSMSKKGTSSIGDNGTIDGQRYIEWEVWTNREGANLQDARLNDTPTPPSEKYTVAGHELDGNITVEKYPVTLNGIGNLVDTKTVTTGFPVSLEDGRNAYKLTYKTKVTRVQQEVDEVFSNSATLTNDGITSEPVTASVTHKYGTKLSKKVATEDKYLAKWEVEYNYFGSVGTKTLTDTVSAPHKIVESSIEVYSVSVDAAGEGTVGNKITTPNVTMADNDRTFSMNMASPNGEAYFIKYNTVLDQGFVEEDGRISNKISDGTNNPPSVGFDYKQNIITKDRTVDHGAKEITWTIDVDIEHDTKDFTIEDVFSSDTANESRQTLVNHDNNPFTMSSGAPTFTPTIADPTKGFTLAFGDLSQGTKFSITYKTKFDILPNGTSYSLYKNTATANWENRDTSDTKSYSAKDDAEYRPGSNTTNNGYKDGSFDHVEQVFNWNLAVNISKRNINGATLVDTITLGHKLVRGSIEVWTLNLSGNDTGTKGTKVEESTGIFKVTQEADQEFTITFNQDTSNAYIIIYKTVDSDDIIGNEGTNLYENTATFTTPGDGTFKLPASTTVKNANKLINKTASPNGTEETIVWTVDINESHSALGDIILTDKMSTNQLILPGTFTKSEITMDAAGNLAYGTPVAVIPVINSTDNSFTLDLGNLNQKGYRIQYKTFFLGGPGDKFSNEASINYAGATIGVDHDSNVKDQEFNFNDSDGTISSVKGKLEIYKVGINPNTGEQKILENVQFALYDRTGNVELYKDTTDADGKLTFEDVRYGKYVLKEVNNPHSGYKTWADKEIIMGVKTDFNVNDGKSYVVENIEDIPLENACTSFTLTVKDVDGNGREGVTVKLVNKNDKSKEILATTATDADGKVIINGTNNLPAGPYEVFEIDGQDEVKLEDIVVNYVNCEAEIAPGPTCNVFTITVKDVDGKVRPNVTVTLKDAGDADVVVKDENGDPVTLTTGNDGEVTIPSGQLPAGDYKVYEAGLKIGDIKVSYKDNCQTDVQPFPACDDFTVIVNNVDGEVRPGVEVTIKDKNGNDVTVKDEQDNPVTLKTDGDGKVTIPSGQLPAGDYKVYENDVEIGDIEVSYIDGKCLDIVQPYPTCPNFVITVNDVNGVLKNKVVTLKDQVTKDTIKTLPATDENGQTKLGNDQLPSLPAGTYDVYDGGFLIGEIEISYLNGNCEAEVIAISAPTCTTFTLTVNDRSNNPRQDVEIIVKDAVGNVVTGTSPKTDQHGQITFDSVIERGKYKVYEVNASGKEKEINSFTVEDDCEATVKPKPTPGGGGGTPPPVEQFGAIHLTKVDAANADVKLAGATFNILNVNGNKIGQLTTDASGKAVSSNLPFGSYTLEEVEAPAGYELATETVEVTLNTAGSVEVIVENTKKPAVPVGKIKLLKVDADDKDKKLAGAKFYIVDKDNQAIGEVVTDANGEAVSADLPFGDYTLVEFEAPTDYELSTSPVSVTVDQEAIVEVTVENTKIPEVPADKAGQIKVTKVDAANADTKLAGAKFNIEDAEGKVVGTLITDANGEAVSKELPFGTYNVIEVEAPTGYVLSKEAVDVTIDQEAIVEITVKNIKTPADGVGHIKVMKVDAFELYKKLAGAKFNIEDAEGKVVGTLITDENGEAVSEELPFGTYNVIEVEAPEGYELDGASVRVTIDKSEVVSITVENTKVLPPSTGGGGSGGGGGGSTPPPINPNPVDPVDPVDPVNPVNPVDPPVNPVDPIDPIDPVEPINPVDPEGEDGVEGTEGEDGQAGNTSKEPEDPVQGAGGEKAEGGNLGATEVGNAANVKNTADERLPQTGEENLLYMTILGFTLMLMGAVLVGRRKKQVNK